MGALGDLKALVFKGYLETTAVISMDDPGNPTAVPPVPASTKDFTFTMRTPNMLEEAEGIALAGFDKLPTKENEDGSVTIVLSGPEFSRYILGLLCVVVKSVNGEAVTPAEMEDFLKSVPAEISTQLWVAYAKLGGKASAAGVELKN